MNIRIKSLLKSPYLSLTAAAVLLVTAGFEVYDGLEEFQMGAEHGLFIYAITQILKVVPDIAEAVDDLDKGLKKKAEA